MDISWYQVHNITFAPEKCTSHTVVYTHRFLLVGFWVISLSSCVIYLTFEHDEKKRACYIARYFKQIWYGRANTQYLHLTARLVQFLPFYICFLALLLNFVLKIENENDLQSTDSDDFVSFVCFITDSPRQRWFCVLLVVSCSQHRKIRTNSGTPARRLPPGGSRGLCTGVTRSWSRFSPWGLCASGGTNRTHRGLGLIASSCDTCYGSLHAGAPWFNLLRVVAWGRSSIPRTKTDCRGNKKRATVYAWWTIPWPKYENEKYGNRLVLR